MRYLLTKNDYNYYTETNQYGITGVYRSDVDARKGNMKSHFGTFYDMEEQGDYIFTCVYVDDQWAGNTHKEALTAALESLGA
jgi:hypothetical protein